MMARGVPWPGAMGHARPEGDTIVGVDVGGSSIAGGLVTAQGKVLSHVQRPTRGDGPGDAVERLLDVVTGLEAEARRRGLTIAGVGVGLPGIVDVERGMMVSSENFVPEFAQVSLAGLIRERTGLTTSVDNDVNALALGELEWGAGRGAASFLVLAIGTGVGGALVVDGTLVRGRNGYCGEFGHVSVMMNGPICFCGGRGCLSAFAAGRAIEQTAQLRLRARPQSKLLVLAGGEAAGVTAAMVFEAAASGDELARAIVDEACEAIAAAVGGLLNALNPQLAVLTGGVARSLVPLRDDLLRRMTRYALAHVLDDTTVRISPADKSSSMRGAAALFLYESARRQAAPVTDRR